MTFEDFCHYFTDISICHHVNNSRWIVFPPSSKSYHEYVFHGAWVSDHRRGIYSNRSGGCVNFTDTFLQNPQYRFDVPDSVSEDKDQMIMFSLMQRDVRERKVHGVRHMTIGLHAMKVEENRKYRMHQIQRGVGTSDYVNTRSVFLKLNPLVEDAYLYSSGLHSKKKLKPGRYIVMPTTFAPGETGEFMLRIYSTYGCSPAELTKDESTGGRLQKCMGMCKKEAICVTRLTIYRATTLQKEDKWGSVDPYVYIDCEGHKMQSPAVKDSYNPVWNYAVMFHRRCPEKPIKIDIYNDNMLKDSHMGTVFVSAPVTNDCQRHELSLHEAGGTPTAPAPLRSGTLVLEVATYDDLLRL